MARGGFGNRGAFTAKIQQGSANQGFPPLDKGICRYIPCYPGNPPQEEQCKGLVITMSDLDWVFLALFIRSLGKVISVKVEVNVDVVALLKYLDERKKDKKDR